MNLEQSGSIGGSFVVVIILRNFSRLLIREFRTAPIDATFLAGGIQCVTLVRSLAERKMTRFSSITDALSLQNSTKSVGLRQCAGCSLA